MKSHAIPTTEFLERARFNGWTYCSRNVWQHASGVVCGTKHVEDYLARNVIPPMTHPLAEGNRQPPVDGIRINNEEAHVPRAIFDQLGEYSTSLPTAVYEGKIWKARKTIEIDGQLRLTDEWLLRWFGNSDKPGMVSNQQRRLVIIP